VTHSQAPSRGRRRSPTQIPSLEPLNYVAHQSPQRDRGGSSFRRQNPTKNLTEAARGL